jgi:hypothetical protein
VVDATVVGSSISESEEEEDEEEEEEEGVFFSDRSSVLRRLLLPFSNEPLARDGASASSNCFTVPSAAATNSAN